MLSALQGLICPYCRQPVFLKGAHLRHRKGRAARVDAHFCHYSTADDLLCILFNPNKSQESSTETIQGVAHHQILSLFYSLPSQEETSSWHNDLIRQEALSLAWLLDSLEIGIIEEDEQSLTWPVGMRRLPKAPEHLLRRLKHKDLFRIGLRSFGLINSKKCGEHYLAEFTYPFNAHFNRKGLSQRLLNACISCRSKPEERL